jgi:hypothetical protein
MCASSNTAVVLPGGVMQHTANYIKRKKQDIETDLNMVPAFGQ